MPRNLLVVHDLLEAAHQPDSLHRIYAEFLFAELKRHPQLTAYITAATLNYVLGRTGNSRAR